MAQKLNIFPKLECVAGQATTQQLKMTTSTKGFVFFATNPVQRTPSETKAKDLLFAAPIKATTPTLGLCLCRCSSLANKKGWRRTLNMLEKNITHCVRFSLG